MLGCSHGGQKCIQVARLEGGKILPIGTSVSPGSTVTACLLRWSLQNDTAQFKGSYKPLKFKHQ